MDRIPQAFHTRTELLIKGNSTCWSKQLRSEGVFKPASSSLCLNRSEHSNHTRTTTTTLRLKRKSSHKLILEWLVYDGNVIQPTSIRSNYKPTFRPQEKGRFWNQSEDFGIAETLFPSVWWLLRNKKKKRWIISELQQYYYVKLFESPLFTFLPRHI